jgi:hypothetical protein
VQTYQPRRRTPRRYFGLESSIAPLVFTPLNLAINRFSQHMRAILKSLQHVIDASDCPGFHPQKDGF